MKILVVSQHYWPEPFPSSDVCQQLVDRGHTVHVVTDVPNYPMGYIYPDYKAGKRRTEEHNGVRIFRTFTIGRRNNILFRLLNYYSFAISSTLFVQRLKGDYDVVFTYQSSPVMMANAALSYAKKWKKKCVLYCLDLWPASLAAGGITEQSLIYRLFHRVSRRIYRKADRILITSPMFRDYFKDQFDIDDEKIAYLPQYADPAFDTVYPSKEEDGIVDLLFAGNVGTAQSIDTILDAAKLLQGRASVRWHIVGDGSELNNLKRKADELALDNVIFHGRKPREDMPKYYAMADAMLVTLTADPVISMTLPAKVQSYMAAGKPVIAAANGEIPRVIADSGCGFCGAAEDAVSLAEAVERFVAFENKALLGKKAKDYYHSHFTVDMYMNTLLTELESAR